MGAEYALRKQYESIAIIIVIALVISIAAITAYDLLGGAVGQNQPGKTDSFIQQPVVDIIIPSLFRQTSTGGINSPLNLTRGENLSFSVYVYSTVDLNVSMEFRAFQLASVSLQAGSTSSNNNVSETMSVAFDPSFFKVGEDGSGNTTINLHVKTSAQVGAYSAVISASNLNNSSETWGDILQINVDH
ncbi:MAG: hypothetical protein ACREBS_05875 [Nitrososphaerales archaeon]